MSTASWRPVVGGGVAGALAILASQGHGHWPLLVPFATAIAVGVLATRRGAAPLVVVGAGCGAAVLYVLLVVAAVIAVAVVALSNQPWLWIRLAALVVAVTGDGDRRVHVRTSIQRPNDPAYAGVSHAWTVGLGRGSGGAASSGSPASRSP